LYSSFKINSFTITSLNSLPSSPIKEIKALISSSPTRITSSSTGSAAAAKLSSPIISNTGVATTLSSSSTGTSTNMNNDTIRLLSASGPLMQPNFPSNMPRPSPNMMPPNMAAAAAAAGMDQTNQFNRALQAQAQMIAMCQNMPPEELMAHLPRQFMMDPSAALNPYFFAEHKRKNATREITQPLKIWLTEHRKNPYPSKPDKVLLALMTGMTLTQVSTWFANARRRLKKENKMTWQPRNSGGDSDDDDDGNDTSMELSSNDLKPSNEVLRTTFKSDSDLDSPKKANKIWSIADAINPRADSAASNISSTSKSSHNNIQEEKPIFPTTSSASSNNSLLLGQTPIPSSSTNNLAAPGMPQFPPGFPNQMLMQAMAANRLPMPQQIYAFMQQQHQQQQQHAAAAQVQQAAAALQQQQQIAAMLRNAGNFHPMLFNNLFMPGSAMNGGLPLPPQPSTSTTSSNSPSPHDAANTSSPTIDCDTTATTTVSSSSSNPANISGSTTVTTASDDGGSISPSLPLEIKVKSEIPFEASVKSASSTNSSPNKINELHKSELKTTP
jgi:hypothetical protein